MPFYKCSKGSGEESTPTQSKTITATTSQQTVTPDDGYALSSVTVNPQNHTDTYIPTQNKSNNDMGANHDKRYVNTSGMYIPSGSQTINTNGTYDIKTKASVIVNVPSSDMFFAVHQSANKYYALTPGKGVYKGGTTSNYYEISIVSEQWASATNTNGYKPYQFSAWNIKNCGFQIMEWKNASSNNLNCWKCYNDGTYEKLASNGTTGTTWLTNVWYLYVYPGTYPTDLRFY